MDKHYWGDNERKVELTDEQKKVHFQTLWRNGDLLEPLEDVDKIRRKAEVSASKAKAYSEKERLIDLALKEIHLASRKAQTRYRQLEEARALDDPTPFFDYLDNAEQAFDSLVILRESLDLRREPLKSSPEVDVESPMPSTLLHHDLLVPNIDSENMNVREVADYLKVSKSTIYHLAADDLIPVKRIGSRLVFFKKAIDGWDPSSRKETDLSGLQVAKDRTELHVPTPPNEGNRSRARLRKIRWHCYKTDLDCVFERLRPFLECDKAAWDRHFFCSPGDSSIPQSEGPASTLVLDDLDPEVLSWNGKKNEFGKLYEILRRFMECTAAEWERHFVWMKTKKDASSGQYETKSLKGAVDDATKVPGSPAELSRLQEVSESFRDLRKAEPSQYRNLS